MSGGSTTANGQLIYRRNITGDFKILHNNVTIQESQISGMIEVARGTTASGTIVEDSTILGSGLEGISLVNSINGVFQRNNICCKENFMTVWTGTNAQILNNYMHDESGTSSSHFDGIEAYCWKNGLKVRGNTILLKQSSGAVAPLNITPTGCAAPHGQLLAEYNILKGMNSVYVILGDDSQGGAIEDAVFNFNRIWPPSGGSAFSLRNTTGQSHYSGTGNTNYNTGVSLPVK